MSEIFELSGEQRKLLLDLSVAMGTTSDVIQAEEMDRTTPEHARGFLECFCRSGRDDTVLLTYFVVRMLLTKE